MKNDRASTINQNIQRPEQNQKKIFVKTEKEVLTKGAARAII